ncbi:hypothetical protein BD560DRAFT_427019 [Blakeslea trispora]|nr:hypothetical protein BD560DRAFT_427019 [Blakeslea trispora]
MSTLTSDLDSFVRENRSCSLSDFLYQHIDRFEKHNFSKLDNLKKHFVKLFCDAYRKAYGETEQPVSDASAEDWETFFLYNKTTSTAIRECLFQYFYFVCENKSAGDFLEKNKAAFTEFKTMATSNAKTLLDKMSLKMLEDYKNLTNDEKNVLKLSLLYIVDMSADNLDIYRKYITHPAFWKDLNSDAVDITEEMNQEDRKEAEELCKLVIEVKSQQDIYDGLDFVLLEKSKLLRQKKQDSNKYQILQVFEYILENLDNWSKNTKKSEAELVERVNTVVSIFLRDTELYTKTNYSMTCSSRSAMSKSESAAKAGRKIDMIIKNSKGQELAYCEFKAVKSPQLCHYQHSKNLRLNQQILFECTKVCDEQQVVAFNWEGLSGVFFVLEQKHGVTIARDANGFYVPEDLEALDDNFIITILTFIAWKQHLEKISASTKKAAYSSKRSDTGAYPQTCFTAVKRRKYFE